jgi:lysophospholipase L1-like esterase
MSDPFVLAIGLLSQLQPSDATPDWMPVAANLPGLWFASPQADEDLAIAEIAPTVEIQPPEFSQTYRLGASTNLETNHLETHYFETNYFAANGLETNDLKANHLETHNLETNRFEYALWKPSAEPVSPQQVSQGRDPVEAIAYARLAAPRPVSGSQLYLQRWAALQAGQTYTRLPGDSFHSAWMQASRQPTYEDWKELLACEAQAIASGQGSNHLSILLGDSISLWFPQEGLPSGKLWLNQGISGDTSGGILERLWAFADTRPDTIYLLAGINDLRRGSSDNEILWNQRAIVRHLKTTHPQAEIVIQSILPTRLTEIPNDRIGKINQKLAAIAREEGVRYMNLNALFADRFGNLRSELTTDGLHLNQNGYQVWQQALHRAESWIALHRDR